MKSLLLTILLFTAIVICLPRICFAFQMMPEIQSSEIEQIREKAFESSNTWDREKISEASSLYLRLSKISLQQKNISQTSFYLREAARLNLTLNDTKYSLELLEKSLNLEKGSRNIEGEAETLSQLSCIYSNTGNYKEGNSSLNKLTKMLDRLVSPGVKADVYYFLGETYYARQDVPKFIEFYTQSLQFYKDINDQRGEAKVLSALSYAYLGKDDVQKGLFFSQEALKKWLEIGDVRGKTLSKVAIGLSYFRLGQSTNALTYFNEAKMAFPENVDNIERGILMNNIGRVYESIGDCNGAISNLKKAADIFNEENNSSFALGNFTTLGSISYQCGYKDEALTYLQHSLKIAKLTRSNHDIMYIFTELGLIYANENLFVQSKSSYKKALEILKINDYQFDKSRALSGLGKLYLKFNKTNLALQNYLSSLKINAVIKDKFSTAETLYDLAKLYSINNPLKALANAKESIEVTESLYTDVANSKLKSTYFSNVFNRYELYINLLMRLHTDSPNENFAFEALQAAEKSRARSMLENLSLSEANLTKDADAETIRREKEIRVSLNAKADKLTDLLSSNAEKSETDKLDGEINELNNELEDIKAKLKQNSPIYSAIKNPAPFDVGEFQRDVLDENSLLLEFSFGKDESYLWLVGKTQMSSYVLPPREQIETRIEKLRELIASREMRVGEAIEDYQKRIAAAEVDYQTEARELSGQLFGQIADKLSGKRLIIVPDGKLHYFPVAALPLPNSASNEPILLTNETIYEPSAQTLLLLEKSRRESSAAKNLLVFSDPVFTDSDARLSPENKPAENAETASADKFRYVESLNSLARLTASKDESDSITNIVGASASDVYSGFAANRDQLLNIKTEDYKILHFATHGLTNEQRPELSGIILSRFDEKGQKIDESFRIHDIYGLNLNADLVVLSACETGLGKEVKGEGLMSLNNAFLQTGAKTVMASLWKVEDGATLNLMKNFYNEMTNENLTPSQALRQAQIKLRQNPQYQSPFYWAAFTVQGDFKTAPKISRSSVKPLYFLTIAPLILFGFYLFRKIFWEINYLCKYGRKHSL